jgi:hypothetical protein
MTLHTRRRVKRKQERPRQLILCRVAPLLNGDLARRISLEPHLTIEELVPRPELFALFDGYRLSSLGGGRSPIQSRPARPAHRAPAVLSRQRGMLPGLHRLERTAALQGEGSGDNAGVRGPACDGCGHVDRLIP